MNGIIFAMVQEFGYFHMKAYKHTERQTDRHDTFYMPVWSLVSLTPINSRCRVLFGW